MNIGITEKYKSQSHKITATFKMLKQARRHGGHSGTVTAQITAFAPPPSPERELCPPKRGFCPEESNRLGATGVQFESWEFQNTGYHPRIREQELFFSQILQ